VPYGPEVSWPSGFRAVDFDSGEYRALVESSYERDEYSQVDPRSGGDRRHPYGEPGQMRRAAPGYQQPADDFGYGDPGYADPGYDGPGHDRSRGYQPPARPEVRHQQPVYPVTGAQEVYREPEARLADPRPEARPAEARAAEFRPADPRLEGLRYDELRYDDADADDNGHSRYDEPLDDDAWINQLRAGGPAQPMQPQRPAGGGMAPGGGPLARRGAVRITRRLVVLV